MQGVAAPCQNRYVHYVEEVLKGRDFVSPRRVIMASVTMHGLPMARCPSPPFSQASP